MTKTDTMPVGGLVALIAPSATANSVTGESSAESGQPDEPGRPSVASTPDQSPRAVMVVAAALAAVCLVTLGGGVWLITQRPNSGLALAAFVTGAFFFLAAVIVPLGMTREIRLEREEVGNCRADCEDLESALPGDSAHRLQQSLKHLTVANFKQMRTFTAIAQRQARMSYYASLLGAGSSLLVLLAGAALAIEVPSVSGKIAAGSLAAVGTALSAFLSKTFLRAYDMSLRQMSYYYGQPLVHCYLYHAEWLTLLPPPGIDDHTRRELYQEVVRASLKASANAQHHLLSLREHDPWRHRGVYRRLPSTPIGQPPGPGVR